jgi:hypothetical protein
MSKQTIIAFIGVCYPLTSLNDKRPKRLLVIPYRLLLVPTRNKDSDLFTKKRIVEKIISLLENNKKLCSNYELTFDSAEETI